MSYAVKEIFYTLQGEGAQAGRAAVFCRFAGCNLWSGREEDRQNAVCKFCDTDFVGTDSRDGGKFADALDLAGRVEQIWQGAPHDGKRFVVLTGGEPLLQVDLLLIGSLHARGFEIAVETNGTIAAPAGLDWICVSPKAGAKLVQTTGDELKLVFPQAGAEPETFQHLSFRHFFLQPMDGLNAKANTNAAICYCMKNPAWRLSLQTHKFAGIR
jgi:7-carboxy-7-deazaguanine synthase (Cx14CxxC type)